MADERSSILAPLQLAAQAARFISAVPDSLEELVESFGSLREEIRAQIGATREQIEQTREVRADINAVLLETRELRAEVVKLRSEINEIRDKVPGLGGG